METKAFYRIRVLGYIDEKWSQRLGDMKIHAEKLDEETMTILEGYLRDQAALAGVLNTLYDMFLPVFSVEREKVSGTKDHSQKSNSD